MKYDSNTLYKVAVNHKTRSLEDIKEIQELFAVLGFRKGLVQLNENTTYVATFHDGASDNYTSTSWVDLPNHKLITVDQLHDMVILHSELTELKVEQGLISGADALRALADGLEVEYFCDANGWISQDSRQLVVAWYLDGVYRFRLKPRTVKIELEIPAPFDPKVGERYWYIHSHSKTGYASDLFSGDGLLLQYGAWRTEEEIKQVAAALRGGIKGDNI